jgi:hypothetical protein
MVVGSGVPSVPGTVPGTPAAACAALSLLESGTRHTSRGTPRGVGSAGTQARYPRGCRRVVEPDVAGSCTRPTGACELIAPSPNLTFSEKPSAIASDDRTRNSARASAFRPALGTRARRAAPPARELLGFRALARPNELLRQRPELGENQ